MTGPFRVLQRKLKSIKFSKGDRNPTSLTGCPRAPLGCQDRWSLWLKEREGQHRQSSSSPAIRRPSRMGEIRLGSLAGCPALMRAIVTAGEAFLSSSRKWRA